MARRKAVLGMPREYLVGGAWPFGELVDDAPRAARYAQHISLRLVRALAGHVQTEVAAAAELSRSTLHDVLTGRSWPDLVTLAKLEGHLGVCLWPAEPGRRSGPPPPGLARRVDDR